MKTVKNTQVTRFQKKLVLISKNKIKGKSKYTICLTDIENKYDLKSKVKVYPKFFTDVCYKTDTLTSCVKCRKNTENLNSKIFKAKNGRIKKARFVKEQEGKGVLSNLGIKTPLSKILLLNVLF